MLGLALEDKFLARVRRSLCEMDCGTVSSGPYCLCCAVTMFDGRGGAPDVPGSIAYTLGRGELVSGVRLEPSPGSG